MAFNEIGLIHYNEKIIWGRAEYQIFWGREEYQKLIADIFYFEVRNFHILISSKYSVTLYHIQLVFSYSKSTIETCSKNIFHTLFYYFYC